MEKEKKERIEKSCFVISPIGEPESETRKCADKVFKHIITPSVERYDYEPLRADHISEPGIITTQVIQYIVDSPLVIADLSGKNPNVFYELAIRHAIKKPLIQLIRKGEAIPFDVAATRIVHFDIQDLDSVDQAKNDIENQLEIIKNGKIEFDNPISVSMDLKNLKESGNPEQRSLADVVEALTELRSGITTLDKKLNNPERLFPPDYFEMLLSKASKSKPFSRDLIMEMDMMFMEIRDNIEKVRTVLSFNKMDNKEIIKLLDKIDMLNYRGRDIFRMSI